MLSPHPPCFSLSLFLPLPPFFFSCLSSSLHTFFFFSWVFFLHLVTLNTGCPIILSIALTEKGEMLLVILLPGLVWGQSRLSLLSAKALGLMSGETWPGANAALEDTAQFFVGVPSTALSPLTQPALHSTFMDFHGLQLVSSKSCSQMPFPAFPALWIWSGDLTSLSAALLFNSTLSDIKRNAPALFHIWSVFVLWFLVLFHECYLLEDYKLTYFLVIIRLLCCFSSV